jgi:queuosine precursor transporter
MTRTVVLSLLYLVCILLANWAAAQGRWILLGGLLVVPYGVPFIAPTFTLRDAVHRRVGVRGATILVQLGLLASGAQALSDLLGGGSLAQPGSVARVALAGIVAFAVSENADTLIYQLLRRESWASRALKSNLVSTLLDSAVFISLAFGPALPLILGQWVSKWLIAALVVALLRGQAPPAAATPRP